MGIFNNKSKSDKAWDKFQAVLPKYLAKKGDWTLLLSNKFDKLPSAENHKFLADHGTEFFALLKDAVNHDDRRVNHLGDIITYLPNYMDVEDRILRRIHSEAVTDLIMSTSHRNNLYDVFILTRSILRDNLSEDYGGFLNGSQQSALILNLLDKVLKDSRAWGYFYDVAQIMTHQAIDKNLDLSREVMGELLSQTALFDNDQYYSFVLGVLPLLHEDAHEAAHSALQLHSDRAMDAAVNGDVENREEALIAVASKVKAATYAGFDLSYKNIEVKPPVFIRHKSKSDYLALMVSFNKAANNAPSASASSVDHVLFVERTVQDTSLYYSRPNIMIDKKEYIKIPVCEEAHYTQDVRKTLVEHYGAAGEVLAGKLEGGASTKPIKNAKIPYIV
jgi:hypothetical protein